MYHYADQAAPIAEVMLDQHVVCGVGNVYRSEVLWACEMHPFAPVSSLDGGECEQLVTTAARDAARQPRQPRPDHAPRRSEAGWRCTAATGSAASRCGDTIEVTRLGEHARLLYWCPGCQLHHGPAPKVSLGEPEREMDPHPAAAKYLAELPWRRSDPLAG